MVLKAIDNVNGSWLVLDQLQLPHLTQYLPLNTVDDGYRYIKDMNVRGAPAIAIVAALSLAAELSAAPASSKLKSKTAFETVQLIQQKLEYLVTSRPTAVNLADAAKKLRQVVKNKADDAPKDSSGEVVATAYIEAAENMLKMDVEDNMNIGRHGAQWIMEHPAIGQKNTGGLSVLTHCNTGSLATAGYGTALGIVRSLYSNGVLEQAYCTETRPYNQGARLTAYELVHDKIPATLITDNMAAALLAQQRGSLAAIVVGADRVAANGDTANKIGTYGLAILAKHHGVKFVVAAPRTTIDISTESGKQIVIEGRKKSEVTNIRAPRQSDGQMETVVVAAEGIDVWNPAFDVTPAALIDAIVTERGVIEKNEKNEFGIAQFLQIV